MAKKSKPKALVVVESPAKARTINRYLGSNYLVTSSMGHVRDLPKSKIGVDVDHGFTPHYIVLQKAKKKVSQLKKEAKGKSDIYLATDPVQYSSGLNLRISFSRSTMMRSAMD